VRSLVEVTFLRFRSRGLDEREDLGIAQVGAPWGKRDVLGSRWRPRWWLEEGCEVGHRLGQRCLFVKRSFLEDDDL
jgi:hypothetical protein